MPPRLSLALGLASATLLSVVGTGILAGWLGATAEPRLRVTAGVVLLLLAVYRLVVTLTRYREHNRPR